MSDLTGQDPVINEYLVGTVDHLAYQDDNYFMLFIRQRRRISGYNGGDHGKY